jgi:hypothetical protein
MAQKSANFCVRKKLWKTLSKVRENYAKPGVLNLQSCGTNMCKLLRTEEALKNLEQGA